MENDRKVHGHPLTGEWGGEEKLHNDWFINDKLSADDVAQLKEKLGFDVKDTYVVPDEASIPREKWWW